MGNGCVPGVKNEALAKTCAHPKGITKANISDEEMKGTEEYVMRGVRNGYQK
jgi:hypothetical protein